jgi:diguanylate cyclase
MKRATWLRGGSWHGSRRAGLRRQWRLAFLAIILVLVLSIGGTVAAFLQVAAHYRDAAVRLDNAIALTTELTTRITAHEADAHNLWNGSLLPAARAHYVPDQDAIVALFAQAEKTMRDAPQHALVVETRQRWEKIYVERHLWGAGARRNPGVTVTLQQRFGADSDRVIVELTLLTSRAIDDGASDLAAAGTYQSAAFGLLGGMLALVIAVVTVLARRITRDLVRPLETLQEAARRLRAGELGHRVELSGRASRTEVGRLAADFNAMAEALDETHHHLRTLASHDPLTGLPNRTEFAEWLDRRLTPCRDGVDRDGVDQGAHGDVVSVMFIDIDDFKVVNDSLGHAAGDALLVAVGVRLGECVGHRGLLGRLGGDEFGVLVTDPPDDGSSAEALAERIIDAFAVPFVILDDTQVSVTVSIGITVASDHCRDPEALLTQADRAMYTSKRRGKARQTVFESVSQGPVAS